MSLSGQPLSESLQTAALDLQTVKIILYNLLCLMKHMHSANIVHRDVSAMNVSVDTKGQVMIRDFSSARTLPASVRGKHNGQSSKVRASVFKNFAGKQLTPD